MRFYSHGSYFVEVEEVIDNRWPQGKKLVITCGPGPVDGIPLSVRQAQILARFILHSKKHELKLRVNKDVNKRLDLSREFFVHPEMCLTVERIHCKFLFTCGAFPVAPITMVMLAPSTAKFLAKFVLGLSKPVKIILV
jgi:hypothetical protein